MEISKAIVLNLSNNLSVSSLSDKVLPMVTMSGDPTSSAMPFEQFTDNDGADYDKRFFFVRKIIFTINIYSPAGH